MKKYLVTLRLRGQLVKTALFAESAIHARLICEFQFGIGCLSTPPRVISNEAKEYPLLDELIAESPPSIKPLTPKPPKPKTVKPIKPQTPDQMRITQLKANVDRQKDALQRERENQKRRREAEQRRREMGGI
jgi:hypothetical protein